MTQFRRRGKCYNEGMNEKEFFAHYPKRDPLSNKYDNGVVFFASGSYGMAGACLLNLIGARSAGASYVHSLLPESIYPLVASHEITAVYHPDDLSDPARMEKLAFLARCDATAIGSGMDNHPHALSYLTSLLQHFEKPIVADAYALTLLGQHEELYSLSDKLILTPHLGEFARICHGDIKEIEKDREKAALEFVREHPVTLVLKGPETLVVSKNGRIYRNQSGNAALARAGSGDVLCGLITGLLSLYKDPYQAVCDAVWLHGHLADLAMKEHSMEVFDLTLYPQLSDTFFQNRPSD